MKTAMKWALRGSLAMLALLVVAGLAIFWSSQSRLDHRYDIKPAQLAIAPDEGTLTRGKILLGPTAL